MEKGQQKKWQPENRQRKIGQPEKLATKNSPLGKRATKSECLEETETILQATEEIGKHRLAQSSFQPREAKFHVALHIVVYGCRLYLLPPDRQTDNVSFPQSTTSICCSLVVQLAVQQVRHKCIAYCTNDCH